MKCIPLIFLLSLFIIPGVAQQNEIDSLIAITKSSSHDTIKILAYERWDNLVYITDPEKDLELNREVASICQRALSKNKGGKKERKFYTAALANAFNNLGLYFANRNDYANAMDYYEKTRKLGEKNDDLNIQAQAYINMARAMRYKGEIAEAIKYGETGIGLDEKANKGNGTGSSYNLIGNLYRTQGDFPMALKYFQRALTVSEKAKNTTEEAASLMNFGLVYYEMIDYKKAYTYYQKSYKIYKTTGYDKGAAIVLTNIASIKQLQNQLDSALVYYHEGLAYLQKILDQRSEAGILNNIGLVYLKKREFTKAYEFIQKAYSLRLEQEDEVGQSYCLIIMGEGYIEQGQPMKAIDLCKKGYDLAVNAGALPEQRDNCKCLFTAYKKAMRPTEALVYYEKYITLRDTLTNAEKADEIARLDERYKFRKSIVADSIRNLEKEKIQKAETERQKAIVESNKAELKSKKREQIYLYIGLGIVIVFSIFVFDRFRKSQKQKKIIELKERETHEQKLIIEEKQKEIIDSINYAKRIQYALLAHDDLLQRHLPEHFVFFKPKDIVSGDFYWATSSQTGKQGGSGEFYLAVCDSTGHGVPGAFMSLLNISFLNEAINEKNISAPHEILNHVRKRLIENMEGGQDGMDAILVRFKTIHSVHENVQDSRLKIHYAAANNRPVLISNGEIIELPTDKMPVGKGEKTDSFTLHEIEYSKGDMLYLYTDGYADQFGGPKEKKFKYSNLNKTLVEICGQQPQTQNAKLQAIFSDWKRDLEQVDDVCVIGIRI